MFASWTHDYEDVALDAADELGPGGLVTRIREDLERLLRAGGREVELLCAEALSRGATFMIWEEATRTDRVTAVYTRRERRTRKVGQPSLGFPEAVADLRAHTGEHVLIGYVDDRPQNGFYFQVFLDSEATQVIACLGVRPTARVGRAL